MLKIGDFSKLSRVSIRMLRHYDDIGLLKPAETDPFTGYRYYREDQLLVMGRITALKDMGFSLADIVRILEIYDDRWKYMMTGINWMIFYQHGKRNCPDCQRKRGTG